MDNLAHYNEYFVLPLTVGKNDMMIRIVDKPNRTPIGQDRETLTFKALLYLDEFLFQFVLNKKGSKKVAINHCCEFKICCKLHCTLLV